MSVVIAVRGKNGVFLGADSAATQAWSGSRSFRADPKLFRNGRFTIGVVGSCRTNDLLRHSFQPPVLDALPVSDEAAEAFMVRSFVPEIRRLLRDSGNLESNDGVDSIPSDIAVAFGPHLFAIYSDLQVEIPANGIVGLGSGGEVAQGAALATTLCGADPGQAVRIAVHAACVCNAFCAGQMVLMDTTGTFKKQRGKLKFTE